MTEIRWYGDNVLLQVRNAKDKALLTGAREFVRRAQTRTPVDSGTLRDSGYAANAEESDYQSKKGVHMREITPEPGTALAAFAAFYARLVENGTIHTPARSFVRATLDADGHAIGNMIVRDAGRRLP